MSLKGHLDLRAGLVCQGQPSTWDKDCRRSFPAEGSTLDLFGAAMDCHRGQRPWPQSQAVAMDAAPASPDTARLLGPPTCVLGTGAARGGGMCGALKPVCRDL